MGVWSRRDGDEDLISSKDVVLEEMNVRVELPNEIGRRIISFTGLIFDTPALESRGQTYFIPLVTTTLTRAEDSYTIPVDEVSSLNF